MRLLIRGCGLIARSVNRRVRLTEVRISDVLLYMVKYGGWKERKGMVINVRKNLTKQDQTTKDGRI